MISILIDAGVTTTSSRYGSTLLTVSNQRAHEGHFDASAADFPASAGRISRTPTELYHRRPHGALPTTKRKHAKSHCTPPSRVTESISAHSNSLSLMMVPHVAPPAPNPLQLFAIPKEMESVENFPSSSDKNRLAATHIDRREGSFIRVTPPELTAWRQHVYLPGPIKLPQPAVTSRKNSVASLEAFQEAIDKVYQEAQVISGRDSVEAAMDDICEWLDDFGFDAVERDGDVLVASDDLWVDELEEMSSTDPLEVGASMQQERPSTPPSKPDAIPVEILVAKKVEEKMERQCPRTTPLPQPPFSLAVSPPLLEKEENLRVRDVAHIQPQHPQNTQRPSATLMPPSKLPQIENFLSSTTMLPKSISAPELVAVTAAVANGGRSVVNPRGFDWDDDGVKAFDEAPEWVDPNNRYRPSRVMPRKRTRNPVIKMRRFVATASDVT